MMEEIYRSAASILVLRPSEVCSPEGCETIYQILLLHKPRKRDAWQLPQGGSENQETAEQTAVRELKEEAGFDGVRVLSKSERIYQYDFPTSYRRFRPDHVRGQRIEYVTSIVTEDPIVKVDGKEVDKFVWVLPEQLHLYIKRKEYLDLTRGLYDEAVKILAAE